MAELTSDGLNFKKYYNKKLEKATNKMLEKETEVERSIIEEGEKELNKKALDKYTNISQTKPTRDKFLPGKQGDKEYELALNKYNETEKGKKEQENEMFKMVEEFQTLKKKGIIRPDLSFRNFKKMKEQSLLKNKILELDIKYPEKEIINKETGALNKENLKKAIDQAQVDLEISPIDGLTLRRSLNTEGEQSITSGEYTIGNFDFSSPNLEEGKLTSGANFNLGDLNLTAAANTNDSELLNSELGFNYNNELKGSVFNEDDYRETNIELDKTFKLADNINANLTGSADTQTFDGETYKSSDLKPKLSYNNGILSADISKEILEGGSIPGFNIGASIPINQETFSGDLILDADGKIQLNANGVPLRKSSYTKDMGKITLKGTDLLSEDRSGTIGYEKTYGDKEGDIFFTAGGEIEPFSGDKTFAIGGKYVFNKGGRVKKASGGRVRMASGGIARILGL